MPQVELGEPARDRHQLVGDRGQALDQDDPHPPLVPGPLEFGELVAEAVELDDPGDRGSRTESSRWHSRRDRPRSKPRWRSAPAARRACGSRQHHRHQHGVGRDREDRALEKRDDRQRPIGARPGGQGHQSSRRAAAAMQSSSSSSAHAAADHGPAWPRGRSCRVAVKCGFNPVRRSCRCRRSGICGRSGHDRACILDGASVLVLVLLVLAVVLVLMGVRSVPQGTRADRRAVRPLHPHARPGLNLIVPFVDRIGARMNVMEQVLDVPEQEVITRDNAMVRVDGVVFYQVLDCGQGRLRGDRARQRDPQPDHDQHPHGHGLDGPGRAAVQARRDQLPPAAGGRRGDLAVGRQADPDRDQEHHPAHGSGRVDGRGR